MTKQILLKELKKHFEAKNIIEDYSGRYMYGATCVGIIINEITDLIDILPKEVLQQSRADYLGLRKVIYFPKVQE